MEQGPSTSGAQDHNPGNPGQQPGLSTAKKEKRAYRKGRKYAKYSLADKAKVVEYLDQGMTSAEIRCLTGTPESTIHTLKKKKSEVKKQVEIGKRFFTGHAKISGDTTEFRRLMSITEGYLIRWMAQRNTEGTSVSGRALRDKAQVIYQAVCRKKKIAFPPQFKASSGWLANFMKRCYVRYVKFQGEVASADVTAADAFSEEARKLVEEGGYSWDQVYNCDETGLYWKRSARYTYLPKSQKQAMGTKRNKDRLSVLLTCNASGTHKMKPLVIHKYHQLRPYKATRMDMKKCNVYWEVTARGYMTEQLSHEWFDRYFVPDAQKHCKQQNHYFKILLFMGSAPSHARYLVGRHPDVQVCFLPPNTASQIQPLHHEIIATMKNLFYTKLHHRLNEETKDDRIIENVAADTKVVKSDEDELPPADDATPGPSGETRCSTKKASVPKQKLKTVAEFWRQFNIKNAVDLMVESWNCVNQATIAHGWRKLFPNPRVEGERQREEDLVVATLQAIRGSTEKTGAAEEVNEISETALREQLIGFDPAQGVEQMVDEDSESSEEEKPTVQEEPAPKLTARYLSEVLSTLTELKNGFKPYSQAIPDTPLPNLLEEVKKHFMQLYNKTLHEQRQTTITSYFNPEQPLANIMQNIMLKENVERDAKTADVGVLEDKDFDFVGYELDVASLERPSIRPTNPPHPRLHLQQPPKPPFTSIFDEQNAEEPHKSTSSPFSCPPVNSSDTTPAATFNPEEKLDDDDEYYLNEGSSNDSDDNNEGVTYEDPRTLLLTGKTKELMRLLQVYRKNTIEEHQESLGSREPKANSVGSAHTEQTVGRHVTSFEKRLKEQPPKGQQMIRIDGVTYMNVMTYSEEKALVKCITNTANITQHLTLKKICHLVCNFCLAVNVTVPPTWKLNRLAAMEWVKGFMRRHQISHLIFGSKKNCWDSCGEHSGNNYSSVVRENMAGKQVPGLYVCDERNVHNSETVKETIDMDHAYAVRPGTKVIVVKYLKGFGLHSELKKF